MTIRYLSAGVPNLKGSFGGIDDNGLREWLVSGAFYLGGWAGTGTGGSITEPVIYLDASRYSSIYRDDCKTVQPAAASVNYFIRAK